MAERCVECGEKIRDDEIVYCRDCGAPLHPDCAEWIAGCVPFCSECYSEIETEKCPDCGNYTLKVWSNGSFCEYCNDVDGPGTGFKY
jgi:hypothetical protein